MALSRARWIAATTTAVGVVGALAAAPAAALAVPQAHPAAAAKAAAHPKGFFTSDNGRATSSTAESALVRDANGGEHVITSVASSTAGMSHLAYVTRQHGATHWTSHTIPGLRPSAGGINVETHLSVDGRRVVVVIYECDGVFAADTNLTAVRMPEPTQVVANNTCATATPTSTYSPVADAVTLDDRQLGILLPDPKQDNQTALFIGTPGQSEFAAGAAIPTTHDLTIDQITRDVYTGNLVAVGQGTNGTDTGVYVTEQPEFGDAWTTPVLIASLDSATSDYVVDAVTSFKNSIWVGLQRPTVDGVHPTHTLYIVHGIGGQWDGAIPLPHSTSQDTSLRLLTNPATANLHAAFTRVVPSSRTTKSGIMQEARAGGKWARPKFFSHWYRDTADEITINRAGKAVIGYEQG